MIRKFFKNAGILGMTEIILRLKGFIIIPLLTRHFGAVNYGVWAQVGVLVSTLTPIVVLGTDSALIRFMPGVPLAEQKRSYSAWLIAMVGITTLVSGLLLLCRHQISLMFFGVSGEYEKFMPLVAGTLFSNIFLNVTRNWFRVHNNAKVYAAISITQSLLGLVAIVAMLIGQQSVYELVIYTIVIDILIVFALLVKITREYGWSTPDYHCLLAYLKFGLPLVPAGYAMWVLNYLSRIFLVKYSTMNEIGVYSLIFNLGYMVIQTLINPIFLMYPNSASMLYNKGEHEELQKLFNYCAGLIVALSVPSIIGLFVLGRPIISVLATEEFISGAPLIAMITAGYFFLMIAGFFDIALGLVHRQYLSTISMIIACGLNFTLNSLLIPRFSILGAAVSTCLAFLCQFLVSFVLASRYKLLRVDFSFVAKILLISSIMGAAVYGASLTVIQASLASLLLLTLLGVIIYSILLLIFRIFSVESFKSSMSRLVME